MIPVYQIQSIEKTTQTGYRVAFRIFLIKMFSEHGPSADPEPYTLIQKNRTAQVLLHAVL